MYTGPNPARHSRMQLYYILFKIRKVQWYPGDLWELPVRSGQGPFSPRHSSVTKHIYKTKQRIFRSSHFLNHYYEPSATITCIYFTFMKAAIFPHKYRFHTLQTIYCTGNNILMVKFTRSLKPYGFNYNKTLQNLGWDFSIFIASVSCKC